MQQKHFHSRRSFLKTLGATAVAMPFIAHNLFAQPPGMRLRHASFGDRRNVRRLSSR